MIEKRERDGEHRIAARARGTDDTEASPSSRVITREFPLTNGDAYPALHDIAPMSRGLEEHKNVLAAWIIRIQLHRGSSPERPDGAKTHATTEKASSGRREVLESLAPNWGPSSKERVRFRATEIKSHVTLAGNRSVLTITKADEGETSNNYEFATRQEPLALEKMSRGETISWRHPGRGS